MANGSVVLRSVLEVEGRSFDVVLSDTSLSWGHVGIEEYGFGKKSSSNVMIADAHTYRKKNFPIRTDPLQNYILKDYS